jgi:hypothetical protein
MASETSIELLDLLLLGAPRGKTELIDGQVLRQLWARTPAEARSLFENLSRQVCAYHHFEWNERHVEGRTSFDLGRMHLSVDDTCVELWVDVSIGAWRMFT